ncbi:hypothetical protein G3496_19490 [Shewanella baltica]|uniref:hypothetical protein n=1 Tax=Shewanella TaxID=22 RepID=UPI00217D54D6|nr:hypothetical protein [Shewanella baltica]MCS6137088.1 hypothetical protein [Shewanella baltica]
MVEKEQPPSFAENILDDIGEVIYSLHETLNKEDVYLLGLNPGGSGQMHPIRSNRVRTKKNYVTRSFSKFGY